MSVAMWKYHFWLLDVSSSVKSAKVGSSANFGILVIKASLFYYLGGPSAKVCLSAKFCVLVFKAAMLYSWGVLLAKEGLSAKFGVVVFKAFLLYYPGGSIGQSRFVCWLWCTGIDGIYALLLGRTSHNIYLMMHLGGRSPNFYSWPLDVSSNMKLPFLTTRCQ